MLHAHTFSDASLGERQVYGIGDSIMKSQDFVTFEEAWLTLVARKMGYGHINHGVGGKGVVGQCDLEIYITRQELRSRWILLGNINDVYAWHDSDPGKESFQSAIRAAYAFLAIPSLKKTLAIEGGSYTGTWTTNSAYSGLVGKYSTTNGSTVTFTVHGSTILLGTIRKVSVGGVIDVTIDGIPQTQISCLGGAPSIESKTWAPQLTIYSGLTDTDHTVVLTAVSDGSTQCFVDWIAGISGNKADWPMVHVGTTLKLTSTSMESHGITTAEVDTFNGYIEDAVDELAALGLDVRLWDVGSRFDPNTSGYIGEDGVHPTILGNIVIKEDFLNNI